MMYLKTMIVENLGKINGNHKSKNKTWPGQCFDNTGGPIINQVQTH